MVEHKVSLQKKRNQAKLSQPSSSAPQKKPRLASGLSKEQVGKAAKATSKPTASKQKSNTQPVPQASITFTPTDKSSTRNPKARAEERMLQEAIKASLETQADQLTPVKADTPLPATLARVYNPILGGPF